MITFMNSLGVLSAVATLFSLHRGFHSLPKTKRSVLFFDTLTAYNAVYGKLCSYRLISQSLERERGSHERSAVFFAAQRSACG